MFCLSCLFLDFDHRIYFSAWINVKKGWICATFVTGNPYGTRVLGKSSQISDWARTHWSCDIGDLNRTLTCWARKRDIFSPLNRLQGFKFKHKLTFPSEAEKHWCDFTVSLLSLYDQVVPGVKRFTLPLVVASCCFFSLLTDFWHFPGSHWKTPDERNGSLRRWSHLCPGRENRIDYMREKKHIQLCWKCLPVHNGVLWATTDVSRAMCSEENEETDL